MPFFILHWPAAVFSGTPDSDLARLSRQGLGGWTAV